MILFSWLLTRPVSRLVGLACLKKQLKIVVGNLKIDVKYVEQKRSHSTADIGFEDITEKECEAFKSW